MYLLSYWKYNRIKDPLFVLHNKLIIWFNKTFSQLPFICLYFSRQLLKKISLKKEIKQWEHSWTKGIAKSQWCEIFELLRDRFPGRTPLVVLKSWKPVLMRSVQCSDYGEKSKRPWQHTQLWKASQVNQASDIVRRMKFVFNLYSPQL